MTTVIKTAETRNDNLALARGTNPLEWLNHPELSKRLSGTLKKNHSLGLESGDLAFHEALAQTVGWLFEIVQFEEILEMLPLVSRGDCKPLTEFGWHLDRMKFFNPYPTEDIYSPSLIKVKDKDNGFRKGAAIVLSQTSISWIPEGCVVFAILAEYDEEENVFSECQNPF